MALLRLNVLRLLAFTIFIGIGVRPRAADATACEASFLRSSTARSDFRIEERLRLEWGAWVRPERLQEFLVSSLMSYRFDPSRYERLDAGRAGVQLYFAGVQGVGQKQPLEIPLFFELLHIESLDSRPWRKFARAEGGFSNTAFGFASTLEGFRRVLLRGPNGEQVFELSRLDISNASAAEKTELAKRFRARVAELSAKGPVLVVALAKHQGQVEAYRDVLGLQVFETFQNPATGRSETILLFEQASQ